MRRCERERAIEVAIPVPAEVVGEGEDEVERPVREPGGPDRLGGAPGAGGIVGTVHPAQRGVVEALHT